MSESWEPLSAVALRGTAEANVKYHKKDVDTEVNQDFLFMTVAIYNVGASLVAAIDRNTQEMARFQRWHEEEFGDEEDQPPEPVVRSEPKAVSRGLFQHGHIVRDENTTACGAKIGAKWSRPLRASSIPHDLRCSRPGCREQWPSSKEFLGTKEEP